MLEVAADPNIDPEHYPRGWFRFFEILPGAVVWIVLILPFLLARSAPDFVTIFVLIFDLYWLQKSLTYGVILLFGYRHLKKTMSTNWTEVLESLPASTSEVDWRSIYHVVIMPTFQEPEQILDTSLQSIINADFDTKRVIFVLATEARDGANARAIGESLHKKYREHFYLFLISKHPDIAGEVKAKGANATWAAKKLVEKLAQATLPFQQVIVTTADADTRFHPQYFARLSYVYATTEDPIHATYQPVPMYFNNIWDAPMVSRIYAFGTTFWSMIESIRTWRLITFSTHAISLRALQDMDYWCTSIVNEDSRQYYRGYFRFNGNFRVIPLFIPIYMDAVHVGSLRSSLHNLYLQQQRWAYGVEHFPYIVLESMRRHKIPALDRIALVWRAFEGTFTWATSSYFIMFVGWIPFIFNRHFNNHLVALNFQIVTRDILLITWVGLFISIFITLKLLPHPPAHKQPILSRVMMAVQWIIVPVVAIFFGSLPAIDAQTRLMLGKYIGFRVTEKSSTRA